MSGRKEDDQKKDQYRWLAPFYEPLASIVFGQALVKAHFDLLESGQSCLHKARSIVWLGGGTGIILNELLHTAPYAQVTYVEPSVQMLKRAQAKLDPQFKDRIEWVNARHTWLYESNQRVRWSETKIDILLTAFVLDVLSEAPLNTLIRWAKGHVSTWFYADFIPQKKWDRRLFIQFMYLCFRICTSIEQRSLLNHQTLMCEQGWHLIPGSQRRRAKQFVVSALYTLKGGSAHQ